MLRGGTGRFEFSDSTKAVRMPRYEPWSAERASVIIAAHKDRDGAALPIFHALQHAFGYVPEEAIVMVAEALNLSRAEMYGTVTFYHDFRNAPPGRRVLKLCRAEACQARGSEPLAAHAERVAGGRVRIEPVYCLGLCSVGPNAMVGEDLYARLDETAVSELVAAL